MDQGREYIPALRLRFLTPIYDRLLALLIPERTYKEALVAQANLQPGDRVLDVGCGTGTLTILAKSTQPRATLVGLDADPQILALAGAKARAAGVEIELCRSLADQAPFPAGSFSRVVSSLFFHHLEVDAKRAVLRKLFELLRPGGELHLGDWAKPSGLVMRAAFFPVRLLDGLAPTADHAAGRFPELVTEVGFRDVQETRRFDTLCGTLSLLRASRP